MDVIELIHRQAAAAPDRCAYINGERRLTYQELARQADALAAELRQRLSGDHTPVAVLGQKEPEMLVAFLGAVKAGHAFIEQGEVFLNQVPFTFDLSVFDLYLALITGGTIFSLSKEVIAEPRLLFKALAGSGATVLMTTPSFAQICLTEPGFDAAMLPAMRRFFFCGETLSPEIAASMLERFPTAEVWNTYGLTETTVATTALRINRQVLQRYSPLPVGTPIASGRIVVLKPDGQPAAENERGEIIIAGPSVSPGYLNRADLTARAFFELDGLHAYHTGDWGHFQDGLLFCDGRMDNQIKLHGYRIEMGDVEANLNALYALLPGLVSGFFRLLDKLWLVIATAIMLAVRASVAHSGRRSRFLSPSTWWVSDSCSFQGIG